MWTSIDHVACHLKARFADTRVEMKFKLDLVPRADQVSWGPFTSPSELTSLIIFNDMIFFTNLTCAIQDSAIYKVAMHFNPSQFATSKSEIGTSRARADETYLFSSQPFEIDPGSSMMTCK